MRRVLRYIEGTFDEFPWLWIVVILAAYAVATYLDYA